MPLEKPVVVREFPQIGKYRVRVLRKGERPPEIDVREYLSASSFEGFTRRGICLRSRTEVEQLHSILRDILAPWEA